MKVTLSSSLLLQLNVAAATKHQPELSYSDTEIDHGKSMHSEGTISSVGTADHLSTEQEVDDVMNKHRESDSEDDGHEVVSPHSLGENHSTPLSEVETSKEVPYLATQEREEKDSPSQSESNQGERNGVESPASDDRNLEQFSEVLLDSDSSLSDHEAAADDITDNKKDGKRVRFADEIGTPETGEGINIYTSKVLPLYMQTMLYFGVIIIICICISAAV